MNENPYAPGQPPYPEGQPPQGATSGGWTPSELISAGWDRFGKHAVVLVLAYTVYLVLVEVFQAPGIAIDSLERMRPDLVAWAPPRIARMAVTAPIAFVVSAFLHVGLLRLVLQAARGEAPSFAVLFSGAGRVLPMLGLTLLMGMALVLGFLLFIVPGVILSLGWCMAPYYLVDANLGPIEALEASWEATKGVRGTLFLLFLAMFGIGLLGLVCCCVGMLVAGPLTMVIHAVAYLRLAGVDGALTRGQQPVDWPG
jgi:uncharacterized membrane protein